MQWIFIDIKKSQCSRCELSPEEALFQGQNFLSGGSGYFTSGSASGGVVLWT